MDALEPAVSSSGAAEDSERSFRKRYELGPPDSDKSSRVAVAVAGDPQGLVG